MNNFKLFEDVIEEFVEGNISRLLGSELHPLEIANALSKALEDGSVKGSNNNYLAPNRFTVFVNPRDYQLLQAHLRTLQERFSLYLTRVATQNGLRVIGALRVTIQQLPSIPSTRLRVSAYMDIPESDSVTQEKTTEPMKKPKTY